MSTGQSQWPSGRIGYFSQSNEYGKAEISVTGESQSNLRTVNIEVTLEDVVTLENVHEVFEQAIQLDDERPISVVTRPGVEVGPLRTQVRETLGQHFDSVGVPRSVVFDRVGDLFPDSRFSKFTSRQTRQFDASRLEGAQNLEDFDRFSYEARQIPVPQFINHDSLYNSLPSIPMITIVALAERTSASDVFVDTVVGLLGRDLIEAFPGGRISVGGGLDGVLRKIESEAETEQLTFLFSIGWEFSPEALFVFETIEFECGEIFSEIDSEVSDFQDRASSVTRDTEEGRVESLLSDSNGLESNIRDNIPAGNPCRDQYLSRVSNARGQLRDIRDQAPTLEVEAPEDLSQLVDCNREVPQGLRNAVSGYEIDASSVIDRDRDRQQKREVLDSGRQLSSRINNADIPETCRTQLVERVRDSMRSLRRFEATGGRVDCEQKYSSLMSEVDSFESSVTGATSPSSSTIADITNRGERLISRIERQVDEQNCQRQMANRVRASISRLSDMGQRVSITEGEVRERLLDRQQRVESLQQQVNTFIQQIPDTPCGVQYSSMQTRIENYRDEVAGASGAISESRRNELIDRGLSLIDDIETQVDNRNCRNRFIQDVTEEITFLENRG